MRGKQTGNTLIELMVSVVIGLLLVAAMLQVYLSNKNSFQLQNGMSRTQENGRFASYLVNSSVRMAGYQGCINTGGITTNNIISAPPANAVFGPNDVITGHEATAANTWDPALPAALIGKVKSLSDVIIVRQMDSTNTRTGTAMTAATNDVTLAGTRVTFAANDIVIITDCTASDIFQAGVGSNAATIKHTNANNTSNSLTKAYGSESIVGKFQSTAYYIKDTGRTNKNSGIIYALYRMDINDVEEELVEGVEDLQIQYGVDSNDDSTADTYSTASVVNTGANWGNVLGVKINFLLNSVEPATSTSMPYTFMGVTTTPSDQLLRKSWSNYVTLRNRGA